MTDTTDTTQTDTNAVRGQQELFKYLLDGLDAQLADDITNMTRDRHYASLATEKPLTVDGILGTLAMTVALHLSWLDQGDEEVLGKAVQLSHFIYAQVVAARVIQRATHEARTASQH